MYKMTVFLLAVMATTRTTLAFSLSATSKKAAGRSVEGIFGIARQRTSTTTSSFHLPFSATSTRLFQSSSTASSETVDEKTQEPLTKVPITLLAGFLGCGKTTTLQHLLENTEGIKIGIIVNDVASVNIDAKLISAGSAAKSLSSAGGVVELQNGCACCTLADELLTSVEQVMSGRSSSDPLDAVVVELSGVADPLAIQSNWRQATMTGLPVTKKAEVAQIVTVVDASTFGTDWMTWDTASERSGWTEEGDDCAGQRKIPELLAEQVESANIILINKIDIAGAEQTKIASALARELNDKAVLEEASFGKISPKQILQNKKLQQILDAKSKEAAAACKDTDCQNPTHSHSHGHDHAAACTEPDCKDESHSHAQDHGTAACADPECTDASHSHDHTHASDASCADPDCADPDCTDTSHSHTRSHSTSVDNLGIVNFVYKATRPFNQRKLLTLLNEWPVPIKDQLDIAQLEEASTEGYAIRGEGKVVGSPFLGVLRSKGFCWFAPTRWSGSKEDIWRHDTAMYWSHAGKHFGIASSGKWWATISKDQMKNYFENDLEEYDRILSEDFVSEEYGDRRQEIVFIGVKLNEEKIRHALDKCLVTKRGMDRYRQEYQNWQSTILSTDTLGPSLFDVGGTDHMDL